MNKIIVTEFSADIRVLARQSLRGNWKTGILAVLLLQVILSAPVILISMLFPSGGMVAIENLYSFLVGAPLSLGSTMVFLNIFRRKHTSPVEIFYGFEYMFKSIGLSLVTGFFTVLWSLLLFIPGIIAAYRYSLSFYILADDPNKGIFQCINESKYLMNGNKAKMFCLDFSFIGWSLLCSIPIFIFAMAFTFYYGYDMLGAGMTTAEMSLAIQQLPGFNIGLFIVSAGMLPLGAYMSTATSCLYDLINGNLTVRRVSRDSETTMEATIHAEADVVRTEDVEGQVYKTVERPVSLTKPTLEEDQEGQLKPSEQQNKNQNQSDNKADNE